MRVPQHTSHPLDSSDFLRCPLGIATGHYALCQWVFPMHPPDHLPGLHVRGMSYSAGVDDDEVRIVPVCRSFEVVVEKRLFDGRAISLRRATAKIDDLESLLSHFDRL